MSQHQFIEWGSQTSHLWLNPKLPESVRMDLQASQLPRLAAHLWIASSGSNSELTLYGLGKSAFLISAESVNTHLDAKKTDIWLNVLPLFHVGGLGIYARAFLSQSKIIDRSNESWSAHKFHTWVRDSRATLSSLVPTQVYDLVQLGEKAPPSLRAIVIGGAALNEDLYLQARALGFPLLPSYGMTECCSQIATAPLKSLEDEAGEDGIQAGLASGPSLEKLAHVEIKKMEDGFLAIKSPALFTAMATWHSPSKSLRVLWRAGDWYVTRDRGEIFDKTVIVQGRSRDEIKVSGELVNLGSLRSQLEKMLQKQQMHLDFHLFSHADPRRGAEVALAVTTTHWPLIEGLVTKFNAEVLPVAKIRAVYGVAKLPKSDLGKVKELELRRTLGLE